MVSFNEFCKKGYSLKCFKVILKHFQEGNVEFVLKVILG